MASMWNTAQEKEDEWVAKEQKMRLGLERKLSTEELMLLSCGFGEDS